MQKRRAWEAMSEGQQEWVQLLAENLGFKRIVITTEDEIYDSESYLKKPSGRPIKPGQTPSSSNNLADAAVKTKPSA